MLLGLLELGLFVPTNMESMTFALVNFFDQNFPTFLKTIPFHFFRLGRVLPPFDFNTGLVVSETMVVDWKRQLKSP